MAEINVVQAGYSQSTDLLTNNQSTRISQDESRVAQKVGTPNEVSPAGRLLASSAEAPSKEAASQVGSQMDSLVETLNVQLEKLNNYLRFEKDDQTEKMVIMIKDTQTDEVIRQIPSEDFLNLSKNISEYLEAQKQLKQDSFPPGLITDETV